MPVPTQIGFNNTPQTPMNAAGVFGQRPFEALASFQVGTGGMPSVGRIIPSGGGQPTGIPAIAGFPGFAATLVGPGTYDITFPPFQNGTINPIMAHPSGGAMSAQFMYNRGDTGSGVAKLVTRTGSGVGAAPSGTRIDLQFYVSPVVAAQLGVPLTRF